MDSFWDFLWLLFWSYIFVAYLILLFHIFGDIFRDRDLGGFAKALWTIGLIFFPFLMALIYLIARGRSMTERQMEAAQQRQAEQESYIKSIAGPSSPADEIARAKDLLDSGVIDQAEFDAMKSKALA